MMLTHTAAGQTQTHSSSTSRALAQCGYPDDAFKLRLVAVSGTEQYIVGAALLVA